MTVSLAAPALVLDVTPSIKQGMLLIVIGFLGFLAWAVLAPLTMAAVAPGIVVADSRNRAVQHLEGGIIREVLVREGDRVPAGQVLVRLDSASAESNLGRLRAASLAALAEEARLIAERDDADHIDFPAALADTDSDDAREAIKGQASLFESRRTAHQSAEGIITQRIAQSEEEIRGIEAHIAAEDTQLALIKDEIAGVRELLSKGLERKPRLLALERMAADLAGQRAQLAADIARARQTIAEMQERLINLRAQQHDQTAGDLRNIQAKLTDLNEQRLAADDVSRRLEVKAPISGKVVSVFRGAPGGVVKPGETILELIPDEDQLVIEAQIRPEDIDVVALDQKVRVRLSAYSQRRTPSLKGKLVELSPDRIVDQKGEKAHFMARIVVDASELAGHPDLKLYPGMPAIAYIETGNHSLLDYLLTPLFNGVERGLREQ
jgi:HlyD family type I secretion membrane fusion protein